MKPILLQTKIHTLRNAHVMLDFELAELYEVETKQLNLAVKRNADRFPEDFMFQLTKHEWDSLRFHFETSNKKGGRRYMPYAFTEQGLAMLSGVLNSAVAIQMNIAIMRTFVAIRQSFMPFGSHSSLAMVEDRIKTLEEICEETMSAVSDLSEETRQELDEIYIALTEMADQQKQTHKPRKRIGYIQDEEQNDL